MRIPHEVLVFVHRGSEFLVLHRSERQGAYWHVVAGGVEPGESATQAAKRELREETGLAADPTSTGREFTYTPEAWESHAGSGAIRVDCFVADAPSYWEPQLDWEHDDYRWCLANEAAELLFWPEPRRLVLELRV
ncbi:MAG: NUDIX pyrophosphatase [Actinobacteria bacterium]|nr:NUDIX pyrophosphatase [Actinomycetota bacterium]